MSVINSSIQDQITASLNKSATLEKKNAVWERGPNNNKVKIWNLIYVQYLLSPYAALNLLWLIWLHYFTVIGVD